jgi:Caspase domain
LFALIIGINNYQSKDFTRLRGAVPDGKEFQDFLIKRFRVPAHQICTLFNEQATRSAIIQAFKDLSKDHRIKEGDPIFIFYAGHGGQKVPHPDWKEPNEKIEVIIPYDCTDDSDNQTPATGFVPSIPDITIAALINEIAREKGNNIVSGLGRLLNPRSHSHCPK